MSAPYKRCPECGVIYAEDHGAFKANVCPATHRVPWTQNRDQPPPELLACWPQSDVHAIQALSQAVREYGTHLAGCDVYDPGKLTCSCGWDEMSELVERISDPMKSALRAAILEADTAAGNS